MGDCEAWLVGYPGRNPHKDMPESGRLFWDIRQDGKRPDSFPPLIPFLNDEGKVCLRERDQ
jgi:hypothetical protein